MICIDFQGGAHGNYLEFVCNKIAGVTIGLPFNSLGASHKKQYTGPQAFVANHYSVLSKPIKSKKVINIKIGVDDLLPLQQVCWLRAGNFGYNNNLLEIDTYHKLDNPEYGWILNNIKQSFFTNQIRDSYNAVKDPSWPQVNTLAEFENLTDTIRQECIEQHKLVLLELSPENPNCPRSILREFFQIGFQFPKQHKSIVRQEQLNYSDSIEVYMFPFCCFYNKHDFLREVEKVAAWAEIQYTCQQDIAQLHDEFLQKQIYKDSKIKCDEIVMKIQQYGPPHMLTVDLLEEAYINAKLGWNYFT